MLLFLYVLGITAACVILQRQRVRPSVLYTLGMAGVAGSIALITHMIEGFPKTANQLALFPAQPSSAYYLAFQPSSPSMVVLFALILGLPLLLWLQESLGKMSEPTLTRWLLWPLLATLLYLPALQLNIALASRASPATLLNWISFTDLGIGLIGLIVLALLSMWSVLRKRRR